MNYTRLFIEGQEVELDETVQFAITRQFEDLTNPTTIINDWSKTVSIPFTESNNQLFGHIYNPDKVVVASTNQPKIGIYFDPYKKLDFRLEWNGAVLMTGYAKMNSISKSGGTGTYNITLNGQLGKLFQEMKKITFYPAEAESEKYIIPGSAWVNTRINKELVKQCWENPGQVEADLQQPTYKYIDITTGEVRELPNIRYRITDILGFAPCNARDENFKYDTFQINNYKSGTFADVLGDAFEEDCGISPDTAIGEGLLPRDIGEYRSYLQLPYIYWNKLFQIFQSKAEELTGYTFDLDPDWFSTSNPYWFDLVYMLEKLDVKKAVQHTNMYNFRTTNNYLGDWRLSGDYTVEQPFAFYAKDIVYENKPIYGTSTSIAGDRQYLNILPESDANNQTFHIHIPVNLMTYASASGDSNRIALNNGLVVEIIMTAGKSSGTYGIDPVLNTQTVKMLLVDKYTTLLPADYPDYSFVYVDHLNTSTTDAANVILDAYFIASEEYGDRMKFSTSTHWLVNSYPLQNISAKGEIAAWIPGDNTVSAVINEESLRSGGTFTLNDLWNNDYNFFDQILKYCKMYRIGIFVDELNKKVKFVPLSTFFQSYTVEDWEDKLDLSKDYVVKPVTWEDKYVRFNYDDNQTAIGTSYRDKYGVDFGEYKIITDYNFNTETADLFNKIPTSINNTDNVLSWKNLYYLHKIVYSLPAETTVYCKDADGKYIDCFGQFFFHNGVAEYDTEETLQLRDVFISDDTVLQLSTNTYFYSQDCAGLYVTKYPCLSISRSVGGTDKFCIFSVPKENYTYLPVADDKESIYSLFWEKYINERYNTQNKQVTCYLRIKPQDYINFQFNKFLKIGNQLYFVNKIYDYDITSTESTKVDLITIQDVSGYTNQ